MQLVEVGPDCWVDPELVIGVVKLHGADRKVLIYLKGMEQTPFIAEDTTSFEVTDRLRAHSDHEKYLGAKPGPDIVNNYIEERDPS